ncbi:MAG: M56 family metallopeptidase [Jaaginema sp. PMC 1078.18]|nr:M56 family metallopeptidase [Jaaginema sp. PMC 1078.18]
MMIALAAIAAVVLRWAWLPASGNWQQRWQKTLFFFLLPILLLAMTAIAIVCMGPQGTMAGMPTVGYTYQLAIALLILASFVALSLVYTTQQSLKRLQQYPELPQPPGLSQKPRKTPDSQPLCAQIGFWQPQLVISQGLLDLLDTEHLNAVFAHEQAHYHYRDTFWFFGLGVLRRLTFWLPHSQALWEELLTLREVRADAYAAQSVDKLLLAEALLFSVSAATGDIPAHSATLHPSVKGDRLQERIDALLDETASQPQQPWWTWSWLLTTILPLLAIPFHT